MKKVLLILALVACVGIGGLFLSYSSDVKGSDKPGTEVTLTVPEGSGANKIGTILKENGVIKNSTYWKIYLKTHPANFQYGEYVLNTSMSYDEIIAELSKVRTKRETVQVTFPEGFTLIQFAQRMENNGLCTAAEFIDVANNSDFSQFTFWNKIPENPNRFMKVEGYLYPDTYEFYKDDTVYNYVSTIFSNFEEKMTDDMYKMIDSTGMTLDEVVTLASFVQEEAGHPEDQPYVAACLRNRLKPGSPYPALECNVCSYINEPGNYVYDYIVTYYGGVDNVPDGMMHAYDTYKNRGLPPGPISNPGIDAIKNTISPSEEMAGYYFFVTDPTGKYYYAKTYDEHLANCKIAYSVKG